MGVQTIRESDGVTARYVAILWKETFCLQKSNLAGNNLSLHYDVDNYGYVGDFPLSELSNPSDIVNIQSYHRA